MASRSPFHTATHATLQPPRPRRKSPRELGQWRGDGRRRQEAARAWVPPSASQRGHRDCMSWAVAPVRRPSLSPGCNGSLPEPLLAPEGLCTPWGFPTPCPVFVSSLLNKHLFPFTACHLFLIGTLIHASLTAEANYFEKILEPSTGSDQHMKAALLLPFPTLCPSLLPLQPNCVALCQGQDPGLGTEGLGVAPHPSFTSSGVKSTVFTAQCPYPHNEALPA